MGLFWTLIISIIITVILMALYGFVKTLFDTLHPEKKITLKTETKYFKEADTNDRNIFTGIPEEQSVSMLYEEMCVRDPIHYEGNPIVKDVIQKYRSIITGRTLDPTGDNAPSEFIDEERNPDYIKYIRNQYKKLKAACVSATWIEKEYNRIKEAHKYDKAKKEFIQNLIAFGIPGNVIGYAVTDDRINTYTPADWDNFKQAIKNFLEKWEEDLVCEYISLFEGDTLIDESSIEKYVILRKHDIDIEVCKYVVDEYLTENQLYQIVDLVEEKAYSSIDAVAKVFEDSYKLFRKDMLRNKYRRKVARG